MLPCSPLGLLLCHTLLQLLNVALSGHNSLTNRVNSPTIPRRRTPNSFIFPAASVSVGHRQSLLSPLPGQARSAQGSESCDARPEKWGATTGRSNGNGVSLLWRVYITPTTSSGTSWCCQVYFKWMEWLRSIIPRTSESGPSYTH